MLALNRAATFGRPDGRAASPQANNGSVTDPLRTIGLDERTIGRLLRRYSFVLSDHHRSRDT
jgi:hypothetical protein